MYPVAFITTEQGDDLILSFAVSGDPSEDVLSLTLLRSPKYENALAPNERGINVSWEEDEDTHELLLRAELNRNKVTLNTSRREFILDLSHVKGNQLHSMRQVLCKMNFDKAVRLRGF